MKTKYIPREFEQKWIDQWDKDNVYAAGETDKKKGEKYVLDMFPYPSGAGLHVGHVRGYTATDILSRFYRMSGNAVLHPMGWDAFGLPAENAAVKQKKNPMDMVPENIANFKRQMKSLGLSYDWDREFATIDPIYYRWTQWLFIQFFNMGLLYKKETPIFYCPVCKTGLAQEEVLSDGRHERCGNRVEERTLPQWIFRITKYADSLLADLDGLEWPRGILEMQRNWIGRKEGMIIHHRVEETDYMLDTFTAFPQWSFADSFIVIAPEHPFVEKLKGNSEVMEYVKKATSLPIHERMESKEKTGVFTGFYAIDPFRTDQKMPIWIASFALMDFGTGAVRCSPHDARDLEFAKKYDIKLRWIVGDGKEFVNAHDNQGKLVDSGPFTGREVGEIKQEFCDWTEKESIGERQVNYHLRDWIFSRQRYWGEPIPMVYCETCAKNHVPGFGKLPQTTNKVEQKISKWRNEIEDQMYGWFPISEQELPLELPYVNSYEPTETGKSPLSEIEDFVKTTCPNCGEEAQRETDTMPNWAGSCWYFLYFARSLDSITGPAAPSSQKVLLAFGETAPSLGPPPVSSPAQFDNETNIKNWEAEISNSANKWHPVDWYIGGAEHAVLHLLYARFWVKAMNDIGLVDFSEPFQRLNNVGIVLATDNRKMSKSLGNVVNPDDIVKEYGADTLRVYEMFMAPFSQEVAWSTSAVQGSYRFLKRFWQIYHDSDYITSNQKDEDLQLVSELQTAIDIVSFDITNVKFNTAISTLMKFLNSWEEKIDGKKRQLSKKNAIDVLKLLAPFAPFMTEEIWVKMLDQEGSIHTATWPQSDKSAMSARQYTIPVQVNGKVRSTVLFSENDLDEKTVTDRALAQEQVKKYVVGEPQKVIYVKGKIINFIV